MSVKPITASFWTYILVMVVMDACPASHHVTVWYCIVQVSIVLVDQTRVVAIEETIP